MSILKRIPMEEVVAAAHLTWSNEVIADAISVEAVEILSKTYQRKFSFFNGKSSKNLVGGLFFLLGFRHGAPKKQRELADKLGTTDVTIRMSYKLWLKTFPDLFMDVMAKLAQNNAFRYFIVADLKLQAQSTERNR